MLKEKGKSQSMPMNIIIIAVILLLVLVIIISIFSSNIGKFSKDLQSCATRGGACTQEGKSCESGQIKIENAKCPGATQECCIEIS